MDLYFFPVSEYSESDYNSKLALRKLIRIIIHYFQLLGKLYYMHKLNLQKSSILRVRSNIKNFLKISLCLIVNMKFEINKLICMIYSQSTINGRTMSDISSWTWSMHFTLFNRRKSQKTVFTTWSMIITLILSL